MKKAILITGASSGIGKATALLLAKQGYQVYATVRKEADAQAFQHPASGITPILLDVTNWQQIREAQVRIGAEVGDAGLMALINNAGINYTTPTELADEVQARHLMEVHFWGMVRMTQQFLSLLRQHGQQYPNQARIVNVGSIGSVSAFPFIQFYNAAKFAILGFTESLRFELNPFGIQVVAILPGAIKTEIWRKNNESIAQALTVPNSPYTPYLQKAAKLSSSLENNSIPAEKAALVLVKALQDSNPKLKYFIDTDAQALRWMVNLLPDSWRHRRIRMQLKF